MLGGRRQSLFRVRGGSPPYEVVQVGAFPHRGRRVTFPACRRKIERGRRSSDWSERSGAGSFARRPGERAGSVAAQLPVSGAGRRWREPRLPVPASEVPAVALAGRAAGGGSGPRRRFCWPQGRGWCRDCGWIVLLSRVGAKTRGYLRGLQWSRSLADQRSCRAADGQRRRRKETGRTRGCCFTPSESPCVPGGSVASSHPESRRAQIMQKAP